MLRPVPDVTIMNVLGWLRMLLTGVGLALLPMQTYDTQTARRSTPWPPILVQHDQTTAEDYTDIRVLTYNVAGLPWPVRKGRDSALAMIARQLASLQGTARSPEIVLIQEGFSPGTRGIATIGGYENWVTGAETELQPQPVEKATGGDFAAGAQWWKGEGIGAFEGSGLWLFSKFPITKTARMSFGPSACAGYDCLANKGALYARVAIPGVPYPLDVFTTHLNSRRAAGVPYQRTTVAHHRQVDLLSAFIDHHAGSALPVVVAGDFNIRAKNERFIYLARQLRGFAFDRIFCAYRIDTCDDRADLVGEAPWLQTEDLQGFHDGADVRIRPVRIEQLFDTPIDGQMLSDHVGSLVTYRLTWKRHPVG